MYGNKIISTEVIIIKLLEKGEVMNYIDFLFYRPSIMERIKFAAPFIKGDPVTENLTMNRSII